MRIWLIVGIIVLLAIIIIPAGMCYRPFLRFCTPEYADGTPVFATR